MVRFRHQIDDLLPASNRSGDNPVQRPLPDDLVSPFWHHTGSVRIEAIRTAKTRGTTLGAPGDQVVDRLHTDAKFNQVHHDSGYNPIPCRDTKGVLRVSYNLVGCVASKCRRAPRFRAPFSKLVPITGLNVSPFRRRPWQ